MAAGLALTRANISTPDRDYTRAAILVRQNRATIRQAGVVVAALDGVTAVIATGRRTWTITAGDVMWGVVRVGGG